MLDCQLAILENAISRYLAGGIAPAPLGSRHPTIAPFEAYATGDGHMVVAAGNDELFRLLAKALDAPHLAADPRFAANDARVANVALLKETLEAILKAHPTRHWLGLLEKAGVPCGPINTVADVVADPQVAARNMIVTMDDPRAGTMRVAGSPLKYATHPDPTTRAPAPGLDEHRAALLRELGLEA
jgi:CoA:oxalate CoA-transferase